MNGTILSGRYRLDSKLGSGGMSTVYLAHDEVLDRPVAVKLLHREISEEADQLERFNREARSAARLSHPNLVSVIDAGEDEGRPYIVFEYVPGQTLKQRIKAGPMPVKEAVAYSIEIGRGLACAHERRLIHRDVKPQNVLIDPDGRAKVTDFGIARSLESEGLTATGRVLGTTDYVAPEQAMGDPADERSDVYSLGIVLYEMLTGEVPFHAETQVGVAMKHVNDPMPDVRITHPEVSASVAAVIDRATAKDPRDRYASVEAMVRDLEAALGVEVARHGRGNGEATAVIEALGPQRRLTSRIPLAGVAMGVLGLALIAAAVIFGPRGFDALQDDEQPQAAPVRVASATDFDPEGDGSESPEETSAAIDSDRSESAWGTDHYDSEDFGGLKDGLGLIVEPADAPESISALEIRSPNSGWEAQVYGRRQGEGESLEDWGSPIGEITGGGNRERIELRGEVAGAYLIWITRLPPSQEQEGRFQMQISDARLIG